MMGLFSTLFLLLFSFGLTFHTVHSSHPSVIRKFAVHSTTTSDDTTGDDDVLHVHVVPHSHDDVGWRKTVDQYFYGWNETIDLRGRVRDIYTTTIMALLDHPARTFTSVETKFLALWWNDTDTTEAMRTSLRYLIANRQWTIVNGGWCMHDEAATHFMGMIDQTTLGHEFLQQQLGVVPKTAWQLDPFGHSFTQAKLMTQATGMDALYFGRIDYQDIQLRRNTSECEGIWRTGDNDDSSIFWGLTGSYGGNYGPPSGFCFDTMCPENEALVGANTTRLQERIVDFLQKISVQANQTKGQHIMLTMGEDFNYQEANLDFSNLDLLLGATMNYQQWGKVNITSIFGPRFRRVNIFYSNPDYYTEQKLLEQQHKRVNWSNKSASDDFFPYSDCPHCFWTGYFTSRASFKRYERVASSFLLAARQIRALTSNSGTLFPLEDAVGIAQHHDAVSGTAKQHVADDYSFRVAQGLHHAFHETVQPSLQQLLAINTTATAAPWIYCGRLNETICPPAQEFVGGYLYVVAYNAQATNRTISVRLPVNSTGSYLVERVDKSVPLQSIHTMDGTSVLVFSTGPMPPLGAVVLRLAHHPNMAPQSRHPSVTQRRRLRDDSITINSGLINASFDRSTGLLIGISSNNVSVPIQQTWGYYTSFDATLDDNTTSNQNSGAYIFRPASPDLTVLQPQPNGAVFVNTAVGMEVHAKFSESWIHQVVRISADQPYVELEYTIGPIPAEDGRGREILSRLATSIDSQGVLYTDSNGRDFLRRQRNARPSWKLQVEEPIAGNYYPINAALYIEDNTTASMAVLVDRSLGGASVTDGSIELMVHRRTLADDARGVDEPLNETCGGMTAYPPYGTAERMGPGVVVRGTQKILVGGPETGASLARAEMDAAFLEVPLFVVPSTDSNLFGKGSFTGLQTSLPQNVMLITFDRIGGSSDKFLIRLGHQYGAGESGVLSQPTTLDLSDIFAGYKVTKIQEKSLTANQNAKDTNQQSLQWTRGSRSHSTPLVGDTEITLSPLSIRTFEMTMVKQASNGH